MWDVICEFVVQLIELHPVTCGEDLRHIERNAHTHSGTTAEF